MSKGKIRRWEREFGDGSDRAQRAALERRMRELEALGKEEVARIYFAELHSCPLTEEAKAWWLHMESLPDEEVNRLFMESLRG
jgi:hypothetical protein